MLKLISNLKIGCNLDRAAYITIDPEVAATALRRCYTHVGPSRIYFASKSLGSLAQTVMAQNTLQITGKCVFSGSGRGHKHQPARVIYGAWRV